MIRIIKSKAGTHHRQHSSCYLKQSLHLDIEACVKGNKKAVLYIFSESVGMFGYATRIVGSTPNTNDLINISSGWDGANINVFAEGNNSDNTFGTGPVYNTTPY